MEQDLEVLPPREFAPISTAAAGRLRARMRHGEPAVADDSSLEARSWAWLYASVGDPSVALQVVKQLKKEPGEHRALYIRASITIERHDRRVARSRAFGHALLSIARIPARLWHWAFCLVHAGGAVLDALPAREAPAARARSIVTTLQREADTPHVPARSANG